MTRVVVTEAAEADLDQIVEYISEDSVSNAIALDECVRDEIRALASFPESGRIGRVEETRELVVSHYRCVVVYQVRSDAVWVLRVLHGGQLWPRPQ